MTWKSLIDKALGTDFDAPQYKPEIGRKKLVWQIDLAAKQHAEGTTRAPNRAWTAGGKADNPAIRFAAKVDGKPVLLDGDAEVFVPASRFQDFLKHLRESVQAGELDTEIKAALDADNTASPAASSKAPRQRGTTATDPQHPKFTDPNWSTYTAGEKIKKGLTYKQGLN